MKRFLATFVVALAVGDSAVEPSARPTAQPTTDPTAGPTAEPSTAQPTTPSPGAACKDSDAWRFVNSKKKEVGCTWVAKGRSTGVYEGVVASAPRGGRADAADGAAPTPRMRPRRRRG